jgi:predicted DNA-binding transcriptional regulator YafY
MSRRTRLLELIQILRDGRLHRAQDLAARFNVSTRTIYRDMEALKDTGLPILGTPGEGYKTTAAITLPPLNLSIEELEALHLGLILLTRMGDETLTQAAQTVSEKIDMALNEDQETASTLWGVSTYPLDTATQGSVHMPMIRAALRARQKLHVTTDTPQTLWPLTLDYWGRIWTLGAWSETQNTFTTLRLDQIQHITPLQALYFPEDRKTLKEYKIHQASLL